MNRATRPIRIIIDPLLSFKTHLFERCMYQQISAYFEDSIFSKYQCEFGKGHCAQHCLLAITEKWKAFLDQGKSFDTFLIDFW